MRTLNTRRFFISVGLFSLALIHIVLWVRTINNPILRTGSDFIAFYTAGRIAGTSGYINIYNVEVQHAVQTATVGFPLAPDQVLLYNHIPWLIPILTILVDGNYAASFTRWAIILLVFYTASAFLLIKTFWPSSETRQNKFILVAGIITFFPLFISIINGQDTTFMFLGMVLWVYFLLQGGDFYAGLAIGLITVRPQIAVLLIAPFLFRRQKVLWGAMISVSAMALCSFLLLGIHGTSQFMSAILITAGGTWYGMKEAEMFNFLGLLLRAFPILTSNTIHIIAWCAYVLSIAGLCLLWIRAERIEGRHLATAIITSLFVVPHLHFHDLTPLLIPLFIWMQRARLEKILPTSITIVLPLISSWVLLLSQPIPVLKYSVPYLYMTALLLLLWLPVEFFTRFRKRLA